MTKEFRTTKRGFKIYGEITDKYGNELNLIESSEVGRPQLRIYTYDVQGFHKIPEADFSSCVTFSVEKAKELIIILQDFIEDTENPNNWRNDPEYMKSFG